MPATRLRRLAASTAVAMAFSPLANAAGFIDSGAARANALGSFSQQLTAAAGDNAASLRAGGFMVELEKALSEPSEKTRLIVYPQTNSNAMLVVYAVVPPKGFEALPIPVCAQQHGQPLAAWNITAKGEVLPRPVVPNPEGSTKAACQGTITAANNELKSLMAQAAPQPAQPPPADKVSADAKQ